MDQSHHELAIIGQVGGRRPAQDFVHKDGRALAQLTEVPSNGQQAPRLGKVPPVQHGQEPVPERQGQKLLPVGAKAFCSRFFESDHDAHVFTLLHVLVAPAP